jgi:hypothetical protein
MPRQGKRLGHQNVSVQARSSQSRLRPRVLGDVSRGFRRMPRSKGDISVVLTYVCFTSESGNCQRFYEHTP